jgi:DNA-binding GntR family transcriptional regulator
VREHKQILAALKARDAERAGQLLARHVRRTGDIVADTLTQKKATP